MGLFNLAKKTVSELIKLGYPEVVAKKIADGTLRMDEASQQARADAMGMGETQFRGHSADRPPQSNDDMFISDNYEVAESYARGGEYYDEATDSYLETPGEVTPLRHNATNLLQVDALGHDYTWPSARVPGFGEALGSDQISGAVKQTQRRGVHDYQGSYFEDMLDDYDGSIQSNVTNVLGSRPDVKIRHAEKAAFDPDYNGSSIMGGGLLASALAGGAALSPEEAEAGFITKGGKTLLEAWHGSPHKFDKFSMDSIGAGEGNQKYGHGLYFADSEDIAKGYRDQLSDAPGILKLYDGDRAGAIDQIKINTANMRDRISELQDAKADTSIRQRENFVNKLAQDEEILADLEGGKEYGHLYRTEIDVTPESLLDWDKPLSEQSDHIKSEFAKYADERGMAQETRDQFRGEQIYERLGSSIDPERGRGLLLDKNIKGIKYLDGDSRAAGHGSNNYVIFDDSLINIAERGNADPRLLAGTAAGTAGLLAAPMLADKDKPLPVPTWGDIAGSLGTISGLPMTGLQGIARGAYGMLTGEDFTEAAAQAGNTMGVGWRDGLLDMSGMNPDKGADQAEAYVTEKTGDESLGWLAKMGLLFGGI